MATERRYALTKIAPGTYLAASNDAGTLYRLQRDDGWRVCACDARHMDTAYGANFDAYPWREIGSAFRTLRAADASVDWDAPR